MEIREILLIRELESDEIAFGKEKEKNEGRRNSVGKGVGEEEIIWEMGREKGKRCKPLEGEKEINNMAEGKWGLWNMWEKCRDTHTVRKDMNMDACDKA